MLAITANLPAIIQGGIAIVSTLITGIAQQLPYANSNSTEYDLNACDVSTE